MAFVAVTVALALLNLAAAHPVRPCCPKPPLPEIHPVVLQSVLPAPFTFGPQGPGVLEHVAAPYEINYFGKPWIVKHKQSAALKVLTQTPVVVDEYGHPAFHEAAAPPAVIVEEVCPPAPCAPPPCYSPPCY